MPHFLSFGKVSNVEVSTQVIPVSQTSGFSLLKTHSFPQTLERTERGLFLKFGQLRHTVHRCPTHLIFKHTVYARASQSNWA